MSRASCSATAGWSSPPKSSPQLDAVTLDEVRAAGAKMLAGPRAVASVGGKLAEAA